MCCGAKSLGSTVLNYHLCCWYIMQTCCQPIGPGRHCCFSLKKGGWWKDISKWWTLTFNETLTWKRWPVSSWRAAALIHIREKSKHPLLHSGFSRVTFSWPKGRRQWVGLFAWWLLLNLQQAQNQELASGPCENRDMVHWPICVIVSQSD